MHWQLNVAVGDWVKTKSGLEGEIVSVNLRFSLDGIYGRRATYKITEDGENFFWVDDYEVRAA